MIHRALATALVLFATGVFAQQFEEQVSVSYVMIPFTAFNSGGAPIIDLKPKEVSLFVDDQPVATDMFEVSFNAPVSWTILLDGSGSMGLAGKIDAAKAAINALTARRRPGDDFALYVFDAEGHAKDFVPFTDNPSAITRALDVVKPWGKTAFFDALAEMPARSDLGRNPSRAIILLSDGIDNNSTLTREQIQKKLEAVAIPIYAFGLREPAELKKVPAISEEMSNIDRPRRARLGDGRKTVRRQPAGTDRKVNGWNRIHTSGAILDRVSTNRQRYSKVPPHFAEARGPSPFRPCSCRLPWHRASGPERLLPWPEAQRKEKRLMKKSTPVLSAAVLAVVLSACATNKAVDKKIAEAQAQSNQKIESVASQVETLQQKQTQTDVKLEELSQSAQEALKRAQEAGVLAKGKVVFEQTFAEDRVKFKVDKYDLDDAAKAALDEFGNRVKTLTDQYFIEIQGHTDDSGGERYNEELGQRRADSVRRYLSREHKLPLNRMSTISYGDTLPVESNKTKAGRSANRRVVLVVLE